MARDWDRLSSPYRARLERHGISRVSYESGESLSSARGHATTPERPSSTAYERYESYFQRRAELVRSIQEQKEDWFGSSERWDAPKSLRNIEKAGLSQLKKAEAWVSEWVELEEPFDWGDVPDDIKSIIGYH